jgi:HSP20 family protein
MAQLPAQRGGHGGRLVPRREDPFRLFRRDFDTLFSMLLGGGHPLSRMPFDQDMEQLRVWDFDVRETDKEIVVRAELPGFAENELDVQLDNDMLTIRAEKEQKGEGEESYRSFYRSLALPSGVNAENVQANYQHGVLELRIPRPEGAQPKRIRIEHHKPGGQQQIGVGQQEKSSTVGQQAQAASVGQTAGKGAETAAKK